MAKAVARDESRDAVLARTLDEINKKFGKGSVMRLGESGQGINVEVISSGILPLDIASGVWGMPRGRVVEVYGPESSGKTTVALHVITETQKNGGTAAFIDAEHALDALYAKNLGVNLDELLVSQPNSGEEALEVAQMLISSGAIDVVVIDSVAALVPRSEIEGEMGEAHVGLQARLMSQGLRKLTSMVHKTRTLVIFINQLREKIGGYGNPEITPGGRALKFYSSLRLEVKRIESIKGGSEVLGNRVRIKVTKNKVAPPFKQVDVELYYGQGICRMSSLIDLGIKYKALEKSGSWYSFGEIRLGQGRENVRQTLQENFDLLAQIEARVKEAVLMAKDNVVDFPVKVEDEDPPSSPEAELAV